MGKTAVKTVIKPNLMIAEPPMYKIVYLNDEITTMSFVVDSLINFFDYSEDTAFKITETINSEGKATVAVLPFELAEQKANEVVSEARNNEYPLEVVVEMES